MNNSEQGISKEIYLSVAYFGKMTEEDLVVQIMNIDEDKQGMVISPAPPPTVIQPLGLQDDDKNLLMGFVVQVLMRHKMNPMQASLLANDIIEYVKQHGAKLPAPPPQPLGIDVEELADTSFFKINADPYYNNRLHKADFIVGFKAGYAASKSSANDFDLLKRKLDFYREQTDKVRELIFSRNDIGEPCQPLYDAIVDKITLQEKEIDRLKIQSSTSEEEKGLWKPEVTDILGDDECGLG